MNRAVQYFSGYGPMKDPREQCGSVQSSGYGALEDAREHGGSVRCSGYGPLENAREYGGSVQCSGEAVHYCTVPHSLING